MIEFKTSKGEFVVVYLPEHSSNMRIETNQSYIPYCYMIMYDTPPTIDSHGYKQTESFNLPQGNWQLFGELSEVTEDNAKLIVDDRLFFKSIYIKDMVTAYTDYENSNQLYVKALESMHSLLKSKGIDINNGNWYLFNKVK